MADLTRFDFHAFRFMRSENVRAMNADEVGQYILLLCEAWLTGKDASLPNDLPYISQLARVKDVSPRVLKQFKMVQTQWGERLQNETLLEEWITANQRSESGRISAEGKWGSSTNNLKRSQRLSLAREKGRHTLSEWMYLIQICENKCVECGKIGSLVKDHITPIYQGGSDGIENIQPLCVSCNSSKGPDTTDFRPKDWEEKMTALAEVSQAFDASKMPTQTKPNQSVPSQTNPTQTNDSGDFKNLAVKYRRAFETRLGGSKAIRQRYAEACRQYSEDVVLEMFDAWAPTVTWIRDLAQEGKLHTDGLKGFYENLQELIDIESAAKKDEETAQRNHINQEAIVSAAVEAGRAESLERLTQIRKDLEEQDEAIQRISENPSALFGAS